MVVWTLVVSRFFIPISISHFAFGISHRLVLAYGVSHWAVWYLPSTIVFQLHLFFSLLSSLYLDPTVYPRI